MPARIRCTRGARACEALLLRDLMELHGAGGSDALRVPIRIIVPSTSLRQHLSARIVAHAGRAVAGVVVHTLHGFARFVLDVGGLSAPAGAALFPLLVRQAAADEEPLATFRALDDGYASLVGTVADLLDAGFEEAHADAIDELLHQLPLADPLRARVRAVVRVAQRTRAAMQVHGVGRQADVFTLARELVDRDRGVVRARALLVHGFADATGVAGDFIASLLGTDDTRIYLDQPRDPAAAVPRELEDTTARVPPDDAPAGAGFTQRFTERMSGLGVVDDRSRTGAAEIPLPTGGSEPPALRLLRARGAGGEVRAVADRIRLLLDNGTAAESIGVVARSLTTYCVPIRQHFGRLGIPFSAPGVRGPFAALQRRIAALLTVFQQREAAPAERWINALGNAPRNGTTEVTPSWRADIRLALHTLNAARLGDVAGLNATTVRPDASKQVAQARRLLAHLRVAEAAAALLRRWQAWPSPAVFSVHVAQLTAAMREGFSWSPSAIDELLAPALQRVGGEIPPAMRLSYDDFLTLIADALGQVGAAEVGGRGAGVQVLDVTTARGVTFLHLFIVGLNRDVFPRAIAEDPLVPDAVRRSLTALLPDLPIKQLGFEEERYLFAQLLSASPNVTLSWQLASDDGSAVSTSPLLDRLRLSQRQLAVETVPGLYAPPSGTAAVVAPSGRGGRSGHKGRDYPEPEPNASHADLPLFARIVAKPAPLRPAHEHAVLAGLYGSRDDVAAAFQVALSASVARPLPRPKGEDGRGPSTWLRTGAARPSEAARVQLAVIDEHEGRALDGLGPYYGLVGSTRSATDPRNAKLFITTVEGVARCPWRTFIRRLLGVQPPPDALESLPAVTALVLGNIVHRVLDRIVRDAIPTAPLVLAAGGGHTPTPVAWPSDATVARILEHEATVLAEESGVALPGLITLMVRHARAYLDQAKRQDWPYAGATVAIVGSEMTGAVQVEPTGSPRVVYFTADRVDAMPTGLRLTDYKTGRPMREALLTNVANGTHLQCAAYALGAGLPQDEGRYLYLKPDGDEARRSVRVPASDTAVIRAFHNAASIVLDIWDSGTFFPRFAEPNWSEFVDCRFCEVRDACLRNDPEYRARFQRWVADTGRQADDSLAPASRAVLRGWRMRAKPERAVESRGESGE